LTANNAALASKAAAPAARHAAREWLRVLALPLALHVALCLGLYQYGLNRAQLAQIHADGPARLIDPYVRALHAFGPLGPLRVYLHGEQDERLYLEYSKLLLLGNADIHFIAERQNDPSLDVPLRARAWPYRDVRVEYPPLAFVATLPPALLSTHYQAYRYAFAAYMLLLHLLNLWLAAKLLGVQTLGPTTQAHGQAKQVAGRVLYLSLAFFAGLGMVSVLRMDHLVVTCTLAILLAFERAQRSTAPSQRLRWALLCGVLTALGVMTKLVPGLAGLAAVTLWLGSSAPDRLRSALACSVACALTLVATNVAMYALVGDRYLDTVRYHALRGVQLESLYAGAIMLLRPLGVAMHVADSFGSTNLVSAATPWIKPLSLLLFAACAGYLVCLRRFTADARGAVCLTCALLLAFVLTNRVFSPQYLIWIAAPWCVLAATETPLRKGWLWFLLAVCLSQLMYPRGYPLLKALHPVGMLVVNLRNLTLIVFGVWLVRASSQARTLRRAPQNL